MKNKETIAVIFGGNSTERKISLKTGKAVCDAVKKIGYNLIKIDPKINNIYKCLIKEKPDLVFIAIHGKGGEDGRLQGFLDILKIPYTGSSVLSSAITMNKIFTQNILKANKIKIPNFFILSNLEFKNLGIYNIENKIKNSFDFPVIIKAPSQGSTLGVYPINKNKTYTKQLLFAINNAFKFEDNILIEKMITPNIEVTTSILGNKNIIALPTIEIKTSSNYFDFKTKYTKGMASHIIPANLPFKIKQKIKKIAIKAYSLLQCKGFARIDFLIQNNNIYLIDINTIPGLTNTSLLPDAAKSIGINFIELIKIIINLAKGKEFSIKKYQKKIIKIE